VSREGYQTSQNLSWGSAVTVCHRRPCRRLQRSSLNWCSFRILWHRHSCRWVLVFRSRAMSAMTAITTPSPLASTRIPKDLTEVIPGDPRLMRCTPQVRRKICPTHMIVERSRPRLRGSFDSRDVGDRARFRAPPHPRYASTRIPKGLTEVIPEHPRLA